MTVPIPTSLPTVPPLLPPRTVRAPWPGLPTYAECRKVHVGADHTTTPHGSRERDEDS